MPTAWHPPFVRFLEQHRPVGFDVLEEVVVTKGRQLTDAVLVEVSGERDDRTATALKVLWPRLPAKSLVEFKSRARGFRRNDFIRLVGYACQFLAGNQAQRDELALMIALADVNEAFRSEVAEYGVALSEFAPGFLEGEVLTLPLYVVDLAVAAQTDKDLSVFVRELEEGDDGWSWAVQNVLRLNMSDPRMQALEGHEEILREFVKKLRPEQLAMLSPEQLPRSVLAKLPPEQRLAGLAPEQRLAGLSKEERELLKRALEAEDSEK